jgi:O-antigen biosynthesis protein
MDSDEHEEELAFTGERFVPGAPADDPRLRAEHLLRYEAAGRLVDGLRVLDVACGEGYGAAMLAEKAASVVGLDIAAEAVVHAKRTYGSVSNVEFHVSAATNLPHQDETFDIVVSFETIEHLTEADQATFVAEVRRVLRPDGLFIVSTPNQSNYAAGREEPNPFHLHELDEAGFLRLLEPFTIFTMYRQSVMAFPAIWSLADTRYALLSELTPDPLDDTYLIAVAGREKATRPPVTLAALWYEPQLSYAALQTRYAEWGKAADATIHERDESIARMQADFEERTAWALALDKELGQRTAQLVERDARLADAERHLAQIRSSFTWRASAPARRLWAAIRPKKA